MVSFNFFIWTYVLPSSLRVIERVVYVASGNQVLYVNQAGFMSILNFNI